MGVERERQEASDEDERRTAQMASYIFNIAAIDFRFSPWEDKAMHARCE